MARKHRVTQKCVFNPATGQAEWVPVDSGYTPAVKKIARYPYFSYAMGVQPKDISRAQAMLAKHGVQTDYNADGEPEIRDSAHRRRHAEVLGFFDRNGGYGDPQFQGDKYGD